MRASVDGIEIEYDDSGEGELALLCLPGWCASREAFTELRGRMSGRRVLALDWRGHGGSGPAPDDFALEGQVRDALQVIEASGARRIVPVATAHAGWVAIELRRRLGPERVPALVFVDWIVGPAPPPFLAGLAALQDPARWRAARDHLFTMWTHGVDHPRVLSFVREDMGGFEGAMWSRGGREIAAAYAREGSPLEALAALAPPSPTLHLFSTHPGALPPQQAFADAHPWFKPIELALRSHFPTIEAPELVAAEIARFLDAARVG